MKNEFNSVDVYEAVRIAIAVHDMHNRAISIRDSLDDLDDFIEMEVDDNEYKNLHEVIKNLKDLVGAIADRNAHRWKPTKAYDKSAADFFDNQIQRYVDFFCDDCDDSCDIE